MRGWQSLDLEKRHSRVFQTTQRELGTVIRGHAYMYPLHSGRNLCCCDYQRFGRVHSLFSLLAGSARPRGTMPPGICTADNHGRLQRHYRPPARLLPYPGHCPQSNDHEAQDPTCAAIFPQPGCRRHYPLPSPADYPSPGESTKSVALCLGRAPVCHSGVEHAGPRLIRER